MDVEQLRSLPELGTILSLTENSWWFPSNKDVLDLPKLPKNPHHKWRILEECQGKPETLPFSQKTIPSFTRLVRDLLFSDIGHEANTQSKGQLKTGRPPILNLKTSLKTSLKTRSLRLSLPTELRVRLLRRPVYTWMCRPHQRFSPTDGDCE
jgi:hypothetical protein